MPGAFTAFSSRAADKFIIRFPEDMRERIARIAEDSHRSFNPKIVSRLDQSLTQAGVLNDLFMKLDEAEFSPAKLELLKQFRQLSNRQQNALIALIEQN